MTPLTRAQQQPTAQDTRPAVRRDAEPAPVCSWEPPRVLWEQELVALTQVSQPPCIPGQDPRCS